MTEPTNAAPTYDQVVAAWNAQADKYNQWDELGEDEKIEWALKFAQLTPPTAEPCPDCTQNGGRRPRWGRMSMLGGVPTEGDMK